MRRIIAVCRGKDYYKGVKNEKGSTGSMRAAILRSPAPVGTNPLEVTLVGVPSPKRDELLIRVNACGICRTDLHIVEGELPMRRSPIILGHQIVGVIEKIGESVENHAVGQRVGVAWLHRTDGVCRFCVSGPANLCESAEFT